MISVQKYEFQVKAHQNNLECGKNSCEFFSEFFFSNFCLKNLIPYKSLLQTAIIRKFWSSLKPYDFISKSLLKNTNFRGKALT